MIYLIHLETKLKHAGHYLGFVESESNLINRIEYHMNGRGSLFLKAVKEAGINYKVVRLKEGDRNEERRIKNTKNVSKYCPICKNRCTYEEAISIEELLKLYFKYGDTIKQWKRKK